MKLWVLWTYKLNVFQSGKRHKNNYTQQTIKTMWNWQHCRKWDTRHVLMVCYLTSVSTAKITLPVLLQNLSSVQGLSSLKYVYNKKGLLSTIQTIKLKKICKISPNHNSYSLPSHYFDILSNRYITTTTIAVVWFVCHLCFHMCLV